METEHGPGPRAAYDISPEDARHLSLPEAEEKMLYLRYVTLREKDPDKLLHFQHLLALLEARIRRLRQQC